MPHRVAYLVPLVFVFALLGCQRATKARPVRPRKTVRAASHRAVALRRSNAERTESRGHDRLPLVVLHTNQGDITVRLDPVRAPRTVENFLKYVDSHYYDGTIFHQVVDGCMVLGGAFTPNLEEKRVSERIPNEAATGLPNRRGTIAMARPLEEVHGATCQFFINLSDNPRLDHRDNSPQGYGYCAFGEVIAGMEVLERIAKVEVETNGEFELLPVQTVMIESASRLR